MMQIIKRIKGKDEGSMAPLVVVVLLISLLLFCVGWEYLRMVTIVMQLDHAVELSVEGVATENWENIYQGVREGYAGAYTKNDVLDGWDDVMTRQNILSQLNEMIDFETVGTSWVKKDDSGRILFQLEPKETEVKIINTGLGATEREALVIETTNTITVPWMFAGLWLDAEPLVIHRTTECQYTPKF
ncbi:hypothetical protein [Acetobacterium sp.]|uniref:hypothetical protein n=1 Tax=Acetobacterium sp. TaxID=1872094 RepID=UPI002F413A20